MNCAIAWLTGIGSNRAPPTPSHRILKVYSPDHPELLVGLPHVRPLLRYAHEGGYRVLFALEHHWIQPLKQSDHCFVAAHL